MKKPSSGVLSFEIYSFRLRFCLFLFVYFQIIANFMPIITFTIHCDDEAEAFNNTTFNSL